MAVLLAGTMAFTSCDDDDDNGGVLIAPVQTVDVDGVYVINEGSYYSQISGQWTLSRRYSQQWLDVCRLCALHCGKRREQGRVRECEQ